MNLMSFEQTALDGWGNLLTREGLENAERNVVFSAGFSRKLPDKELSNLYAEGGLARIICTEIPADGMKNGVSIEGDEGGAIQKALNCLGQHEAFINAWGLARAHGGALVVMDIDDGAEKLTEPVSVDKITAVKGLEVFDKERITIDSSCFDADPESETYGDIIKYNIVRKDGTPKTIHRDRCLYFAGEFVPWSVKEKNNYFDGSTIQAVWGSLSKLYPAFNHVNNILGRFNIMKFGIKDLSALIAAGKESVIRTRLEIMRRSMTTLRAGVYDSNGEEITTETMNVSGLPELLKLYFILVSAESRIPVNRLFTKLVGGLGSEGDTDESRYYDHVQAEALRVLTGPYNKLIRYLCKSENLNSESITWEFKPLKRVSQKDIVDMREKHTKSVLDALSTGLIDTDEARRSLMSKEFNFVFDGV